MLTVEHRRRGVKFATLNSFLKAVSCTHCGVMTLGTTLMQGRLELGIDAALC